MSSGAPNHAKVDVDVRVGKVRQLNRHLLWVSGTALNVHEDGHSAVELGRDGLDHVGDGDGDGGALAVGTEVDVLFEGGAFAGLDAPKIRALLRGADTAGSGKARHGDRGAGGQSAVRRCLSCAALR